MREVYKQLGIEKLMSTAYHLQTDGQMQCINQEVEIYLQGYADQQEDWSKWLLMAEFTLNNQQHSSMGYSPFYLNYGQHPWDMHFTKVTEKYPVVKELIRLKGQEQGKTKHGSHGPENEVTIQSIKSTQL